MLRGTLPLRNPGSFASRCTRVEGLLPGFRHDLGGLLDLQPPLAAPELFDLHLHGRSTFMAIFGFWCERGELNPHGLPHWILSPARLPVPPRSHGNLVRHLSDRLTFAVRPTRPELGPSGPPCPVRLARSPRAPRRPATVLLVERLKLPRGHPPEGRTRRLTAYRANITAVGGRTFPSRSPGCPARSKMASTAVRRRSWNIRPGEPACFVAWRQRPRKSMIAFPRPCGRPGPIRSVPYVAAPPRCRSRWPLQHHPEVRR